MQEGKVKIAFNLLGQTLFNRENQCLAFLLELLGGGMGPNVSRMGNRASQIQHRSAIFKLTPAAISVLAFAVASYHVLGPTAKELG